MKAMKVLLIGAHGRTGRPVARRLHEQRIPFCALLRKSAQKSEFAALGAQIVLGDLTHDFSHALDDITHVIYAAGSAETEGVHEERAIDRDAVMRTADYAKRRRVRQLIVVSALSAFDPDSNPLSLRHYSRMKREADDYVAQRGVPYVILRPGPLSDAPARGAIALAGERTRSMPAVSREDVAELAVRCMLRGVKNLTIGFVGGNEPLDDALDALIARDPLAPMLARQNQRV
ncbi:MULTISPECIES: SDR family oxidoreductase [unclassified Caballeronia]|uniref:SDR family oxidoreductase n=1 Tax=unclassified Caballeronia TaxID=2646786 RepID=UPI00285FCE3B|nr:MULTISPECIES: SDR family oxidoreductase [unclassified Caballeronia]MDR5738790.1 SDR family oxidoreductase [Caballeronia sp. LZ016]MDR5811342.1 SDR family oxidoreductase [Caballeronia sp. LZ019]